MTSFLGHGFLLISFFASLLCVLSAFFEKKNFPFKAFSLIQFVSVFLAFVSLIYAYIVCDFSLLSVALHVHSASPLWFRLSGTWGNHEGSMLLWILVIAFFQYLFARGSYRHTINQKNVVAFLSFIYFLFLLFIFFTSDPFITIDPAPRDGLDINPLLQDMGLMIHPPLLYLGYVGSCVCFALSLEILRSKKINDDIIDIWKMWTLIPWLFLTCGIVMGSLWAYYELGWGGWWFWDPVENASLLPWICLTLLLHSLVAVKKYGSQKNASLLFSILSFSLSLIGTFLIRSGLMTSVHSFASDPTRGFFIFLIACVLIGGAFSFFALRAHHFKNDSSVVLFSVEGLLYIQQLLLTFTFIVILLGTLYPLFLQHFFNESISVGATFFNKMLTPVAILLLFFMGLLNRVSWQGVSWKKIIMQLLALFLPVIFFMMLLSYFYEFHAIALSMILFCTFVVVSIIARFKDILQKNKNHSLGTRLQNLSFSFITSNVAHFGVVIVFLGMTIDSFYKKDYVYQMVMGQSVDHDDLNIKLDFVRRLQGPNFIADQAHILVNDKNRLHHFYPEKRYYPIRDVMTTEVALQAGFIDNFYVSLGSYAFDKDNVQASWSVRVQARPLVSWIWGGGFLIAFAGLLSLIRRFKMSKIKNKEIF